jgi:hypothetical protein
MPFIKEPKKPKPPKTKCRPPWWIFFITDFTIWQCPKCGAKYMMRHHADLYSSNGGSKWERVDDGFVACRRRRYCAG